MSAFAVQRPPLRHRNRPRSAKHSPVVCSSTATVSADVSRRSFLSLAAAGMLLPAVAAADSQLEPVQFSTRDFVLGDRGDEVCKGTLVSLHYTARLRNRNGKVYDSTYGPAGPGPFQMTVGESYVIPGLEIGILGMREGGRRRIVIPANLGYADKQMGPIPSDPGQRRRLYSTVFNKYRGDEKGELVIDVEIVRVRNPTNSTLSGKLAPLFVHDNDARSLREQQLHFECQPWRTVPPQMQLV